MIGRRFVRTVVVAEAGQDKHGNYKWECLCDCGNKHVVVGYSLRQGYTRSCGCLLLEGAANLNKSHGLSSHSLFPTWLSMRRRCYNPGQHSYPDYGGRGIGVCERWRNDFAAFLEDMGEKPGPEYTLERERVNEDYGPGNCKWATKEEQANNKRNSHFITAKGKTQTLLQWSREIQCHPVTILARLRTGMTDEEAICTPIDRGNHKKLTDDQVREIRAVKDGPDGAPTVGKRFGVSKLVIYRIWRGQGYTHVPDLPAS